MTEPATTEHNFTIRDAIENDQEEVLRLFRVGSLDPDAPDAHDPPDDIHDFQSCWIDDDNAHLWVLNAPTIHPPHLAGMIGVRVRSNNTAELCRLRVDPRYRNRGAGRLLATHAIEHCRAQSYLKVVLDSYVQRKPAIALFEQLGFRQAGERVKAGKQVMDFYLDLYANPQ